ncbi:hypothetical protein E8E13_006996 [Curvularia kusanoi]|uniref:Nephrocystin 3-like N-terminal domain-containing protein n=1 Tax=Curvularia kusanoi TaxID=90978 RepID=A0A9P4WA53_CURKU|nr:hypothetical protein E8E13_006996 [Curvularia kusanoi]
MASAGEKSSPYKITQGLEVLYAGENGNATVDIIAVPGLGSNPDTAFDSFKKTSDGKTQFNWLTDDKGLRDKFPTARILLYKSESRWIKEAAVNQSMKNLASNLLTAVLSKREGVQSDRPIIFVGHSMGGLVVAKAITLAAFRSEDYPNILPCITGCLFFGTPFQGSSATGKAIMLAKHLEPLNQAAVSRVLYFLEPGNEALDDLRNDFTRICNELDPRIGNVCFYEQRPTDYAKGFLKSAGLGKLTAEIVVTETSARLEGADPVGFACNHRELNRFDDLKDGRWDLVQTKLQHMVVKSRHVVRSRLKAMRSSVMDDEVIDRLLKNLNVSGVEEKKSAVSQLSGGSSWITDNPILKQWMNTGGQSDLASRLSGITLNSQVGSVPRQDNQCVWLSGPEGNGKSKAALSTIHCIEDLRYKHARSNTSSILIAYFFAAPSPDLSSAESVLKSFLHQLISKRRSLAVYAKDFAHGDKSRKKGVGGASDAMFTVPAMWKVLMNMLEDPAIEAAYFVINSLHELTEGAESTKQLFEAIDNDVLGARDPSSPVHNAFEGRRRPMRWLFTSRRRENIQKLLGNVTGVTEMDLEDPVYGHALREELKELCRQRVAEVARKKGYSSALQYFASHLVEQNAENRIWVDVVCRQLELVPANTVEVRKTLSQAPQNLSTLLDRTWSTVLDEKNEDVEWTKELLRALMLAFRDPTVEELATLAEATHYLKGGGDKSKLLEAIDRCGALVKIIDYDEEDVEEGEEEQDWDYDEVAECRVTFLHDSAKSRLDERAEEFLGLNEDLKQMQHGAMALRSFSKVIKALTPPKEFDDSDDENEDEAPTADGRPSEGPITNAPETEEETEGALNYCLEYWLRHAQRATSDVVDSLNLDQAFWALTSDVRDKWWTEYTEIDEDYGDLSGMTALHVAAFFGFTPLVERLLESSESGHREDIKVRDSWCNQPLHWAAEKGHDKVMQILLDHGADVNDGRQDLEWTPLMMAASQGQLKAMTMLLERHADINACAKDDGTALTLAIACGQTDAVAHLIKNHANPNVTGPNLEPPLALAASTGNQSLVKMIMDARGYQNTTSPAYGSALAAAASSSNFEIFKTVYQVDYSLYSRQSALEQAADVASKEIVIHLLYSGPDLNCDTAFTKAAARGADDILKELWSYSRGAISQQSKDLSLYTATDFELNSTVELLLEMGANPDAEGEEYGNALTATAYDGTIDILTMLLRAGAHIRHPAGYPLQAAASQGHDEVVKLLLSRGADVNEISPKHECGTALHAACVSGFNETVEILLRHGANPNLGSGTYTCPIIAATYNGNAGMVEMLVNARVNVNVSGGPDSSTPLIYAAATLPFTSLKILVEQGRAFVNQVDKDRDSALNLSAAVSDDHCVKYLLGVGADLSYRDNKYGAKLEVDDGKNTSESKKNGKYGSALAAAAARYETEALVFLLEQEGWSTGVEGAYRQALEMAAKYNHHGSFRLIVRSEGGKTILRKVKAKLRQEMKKRYKADDGDDNSDFGDDVVFNEQATDDDEYYEEDEAEDEEIEDQSAEEPNQALSVPVTQRNPGLTGERGISDLSGSQTSNNSGTNGNGPFPGYGPSGYGSNTRTQFPPPPSSTFQSSDSIIERKSLGNQHQGHTSGGHNQPYGQTSQVPDVKPQYRAYSNDATPAQPAPSGYQAYSSNGTNTAGPQHSYNSNGQHEYAQNRDTVDHTNAGGANQWKSPEPHYGGYTAPEHGQGDRSIQGNMNYDQHAYALRSDGTAASTSNPSATSSSAYNPYQQTSQHTPSSYNSNYAQQSQPYQPPTNEIGNMTSRHDVQPTGMYGSQDPTQARGSYGAPQSSYASPDYAPPPPQQYRGYEPQSQSQPSGGFDSHQQQARGFEPQPQRYGGLTRKPVPSQSQAPSSSAGRYAAVAGAGAVAAGAGGYMLTDAVAEEGNEEEEQDGNLAYEQQEEEEQDENLAYEQHEEEEPEEEPEEEGEEVVEDEEYHGHDGYGGSGGYSGGYDGDGSFPSNIRPFSSSFKEPEPPLLKPEFGASFIQHKWNVNVSNIAAGYVLNAPSQNIVRTQVTSNSGLETSQFNYANVSSSGLVDNIVTSYSTHADTAPSVWRDYVNPAFPLFKDTILKDNGAVFGGIVERQLVDGMVATWHIMYQGAIPVTVYVNSCNVVVGYDFFSPYLRTRVITEFFNIKLN